jgi:hypothetical protein
VNRVVVGRRVARSDDTRSVALPVALPVAVPEAVPVAVPVAVPGLGQEPLSVHIDHLSHRPDDRRAREFMVPKLSPARA